MNTLKVHLSCPNVEFSQPENQSTYTVDIHDILGTIHESTLIDIISDR